MKTYVFIARRICEIGGAEQYLYNKSRYLESNGWRVFIFSGREGRILINGFEKYNDDIYPVLRYAPECFSRLEVRKTIDRIVSKIGDTGDDPCIIESDSVNRAIWAELIAKRLNAKHFAFILQEKHGYDALIKGFLRFKYERHELAGIALQSVNQMLDDDTVERRDDTRISAYCNNVVEDCEDRISGQLDAGVDHVFGSIGRLDKPCVPAILRGFKQYFESHPDERFELVLIGGAVYGKRQKMIREELSGCSNADLIITGNMYPIPLSLLKNIELFVSTAGSAAVTYKSYRPTVRVHPLTGEPVGVIGLDFDQMEKNMYDVDPELTIPGCIERALKNADSIVYKNTFDDGYRERMDAEFKRQLSFADNNIPKAYYDEALLMRMKTANISSHFTRWAACHVLGGRGLRKLEEIKMRKSDQ